MKKKRLKGAGPRADSGRPCPPPEEEEEAPPPGPLAPPPATNGVTVDAASGNTSGTADPNKQGSDPRPLLGPDLHFKIKSAQLCVAS